jgi:hypothetical protein
MKGNYMNKVFLIVISLLLIFTFSHFIFSITGFEITGADVNIEEKIQGMITALAFKPLISITEFQNITAEFTNIGSVPVTQRLEEIVYFYNETKLDPVAYYYDSSVYLAPGMKRAYKTVFTPPYYGTYYIKAKSYYETKITERWGVFSVVYYATPLPPIVVVVPPSGGGPITYVINEAGVPRLSLEYQKKYDLYPGQSLLISVTAKNTGETELLDLKLSTSISNLINIEVNPKVLPELKVNNSNIFLISLDIPKDIPTGEYPLSFELISDKTMESGSITLNITSREVSIKDEVHQTILNYEYLLNDLEKKISDATSEGLDVSLAQKSFDNAKEGLDKAKEYYDLEEYDKAKEKLDEVKKDFEDIVFQLANAQLKLYIAPAFSPYPIILFAIIIGIIFLFIIRRRRGKKRPKLLREISEET